MPAISGVAAYEEGVRNVARGTDILVIDAPARVHGTELNELVRRAETIIVPVLPSTIDIKACGHFMAELAEIGKVSRKQARLAVVANRVREYTLIYEELDQYLSKLKVPYLGEPARSAELCARLRPGHGRARASRVPGLARLEAVAADRRVARQQAQPAGLIASPPRRGEAGGAGEAGRCGRSGGGAARVLRYAPRTTACASI